MDESSLKISSSLEIICGRGRGGGERLCKKKSAQGFSPILELIAVRFEFFDFGAQVLDVLPVFLFGATCGMQPFVLSSKRGHLLLQRLVFGTKGGVTVRFIP
jgi:hypothetical protein